MNLNALKKRNIYSWNESGKNNDLNTLIHYSLKQFKKNSLDISWNIYVPFNLTILYCESILGYLMSCLSYKIKNINYITF